MKTIQEHLETLKEPYRTQALNNACKSNLSIVTSSLSIALLHAFTFFNTDEGSDYWQNIVNRVKLNDNQYTIK